MTCQESRNLLHSYVDRELELVRSVDFESHLQSCPACARVYQDQETLRLALRTGLPYFKSSTTLKERVRAALTEKAMLGNALAGINAPDKAGAETRPKVVVSTSLLAKERPMWTWLGFAASLAAVALVTWSVTAFVLRRPASDSRVSELVSSHVRSLMINHLTDVPSSDQHTVKPWFNGKLDFSPPVPGLERAGFPLVGGRLDYLQNRPVAALVYQRRKHFINLFIWPSGDKADDPRKATTHHGYNVLHWTQSGMTFWAVSDLSSSDLNQFGQLMQAQN